MARAALETADQAPLSPALRWPPAEGGALAAAQTWLWLAALAVLCLAGTWTHTGARNGFLESSRPLYSQYSGWDTLPAEGYVSWIGTVPVLSDAESFVRLAAFFLGQQGPESTGFLDRRALYSYLAALVLPWTGPEEGTYVAFVALNAVCWWISAAATYWLVRRRCGDQALAWAASFLVATSNGFVFMAGLPQSYVLAYASIVLLIGLSEWLDAWGEGARLGPWLLLGWGAGVASMVYFTHISVLLFWWVYGLRRVPWRYLAAATVVALAMGAGWELFGSRVVGLGFNSQNTDQVAEAVGSWLAIARRNWESVVTAFRGSTIRSTILGAFPHPWWLLAALGFLASRRVDREWTLAVVMAGLLPTVVMLALLSLPRVAFFIYPAIVLLAARGALVLGGLAASAVGRAWPSPRLAGLVATVVVGLTLGGLALLSNADLLGYQELNARFHHALRGAW